MGTLLLICPDIFKMVDELFPKSLPKIELHAHLNGSISLSTIHKLIEYKKKRMGDGFVVPEEWQVLIKGQEIKTLEQGFMLFKMIHSLVNEPYCIAMTTKDVIEEFYEDGVCYLELRSTPKAHEQNKMTKRIYIETVLNTIVETTSNKDIIVRFLLSIDRRQSVEEAENTVDLAIEYRTKYPDLVVGIDLSGDPKVGNAEDFIPCLSRAKSAGLKLTLHLAEIPNIDETKRVIESVHPDRIGHGTCIYPDQGGSLDLVNLVLEHNIPIEICLTSNVRTQTVDSYEAHHFKDWSDKDHPIIICTDDKGVFSSDLSQEYAIAAKSFGLTKLDLWRLSFDSINYIFEGDNVKEQLRTKWNTWKQHNLIQT